MTPCRFLLATALIVGLGLLAGCGQNPFAPPPKGGGGGGNAGPGVVNNQPLNVVGKVKKRVEFVDYSNEMRQLAIFNLQFDLMQNRPPQTLKEFQDFINKDSPQLVKWINDGYYVVVLKTKPDSNNIVVYQNRDLTGGTRWVAKGDGSIHELTEADFAKQLQQQLQQ